MNDFVNDETRAQNARWTDEMDAAATAEGWSMFDYDCMGLREIERCDESGVFESDLDALAFVEKQAAAGDPKAVLALELDAYFQPIINRVREANAALNARPRA